MAEGEGGDVAAEGAVAGGAVAADAAGDGAFASISTAAAFARSTGTGMEWLTAGE